MPFLFVSRTKQILYRKAIDYSKGWSFIIRNSTARDSIVSALRGQWHHSALCRALLSARLKNRNKDTTDKWKSALAPRVRTRILNKKRDRCYGLSWVHKYPGSHAGDRLREYYPSDSSESAIKCRRPSENAFRNRCSAQSADATIKQCTGWSWICARAQRSVRYICWFKLI